MITEDYVSIETAKLLKENGFDGECTYMCIDNEYKIIGSPTLQMANKWLREKKNIFVQTMPDFFPGSPVTVKYQYFIIKLDENNPKAIYGEHYNTYEESCEAAIKYCLENLI